MHDAVGPRRQRFPSARAGERRIVSRPRRRKCPPPSMDLAMLITSRRVRCAPSTRLDQKMLTERLLPETDSATRGGCSLLALASPGWSLARRGSENVAPPSLLIARYTSVTASFEAVQTTATVRPWAARDGVAFANPARPNVVCAVDSTLREDWRRWQRHQGPHKAPRPPRAPAAI